MNDISNLVVRGVEFDFHDSRLLGLNYLPAEEKLEATLSTPIEHGGVLVRQITLTGVLRVEFEMVGDGTLDHRMPLVCPEIYDVYTYAGDPECVRWVQRDKDLEIPSSQGILSVVLASSFLRGWGENSERLEGIQVICRGVEVESEPRGSSVGTSSID